MLDKLLGKYELQTVLRIKSWIGHIINNCININKDQRNFEIQSGIGKAKEIVNNKKAETSQRYIKA